MIRVNMHEAKTQLSKLVDAALRGEEVVICRADKPVVRLTGLALPQTARRTAGRLKDVLPPMPENAFAPMSEDEIAEWDSAPAEPSKR